MPYIMLYMYETADQASEASFFDMVDIHNLSPNTDCRISLQDQRKSFALTTPCCEPDLNSRLAYSYFGVCSVHLRLYWGHVVYRAVTPEK